MNEGDEPRIRSNLHILHSTPVFGMKTSQNFLSAPTDRCMLFSSLELKNTPQISNMQVLFEMILTLLL